MENSSECREDKYSEIDCSEIRYDLEKFIGKRPLDLHPKPPKFRRRLRQIQKTLPLSQELSSFSEYMFSINHHQVRKTTQSMIENEFFVECSLVVRSGNVVMIPSTIYDPIEGMAKRMSLKEISPSRLTSSEENSLPYFVFIADDCSCETIVASPMKLKPSENKSLDYVYSFHSLKASGNLSNKSVTYAPHIVGRMTVSSSLIVSLNRSKFMETEFVLFDSKGEQSMEKDVSSSQLKKLATIFRPSSTLKRNTKSQMIDESECQDGVANGLSPILELAAIVTRDYGYKESKGEAFGGWGLKFLEKVESKNSLNESHEERHKHLNVLLPAGLHGGQVMKDGGPSSLIDRWKAGGHCDCGGWDVGCPLTVLKSHSVCSKTDLEEHCKPFELFIEGRKKNEPTLKLMNVSKGIYVVNFEPTLSALQSFSIAVAFIHSHETVL
ncbi:uncharacterized protein LOC122045953 [Zingiber officinale]|uniref:uncharacterized protein LOC122045953 n=1 Tax=Zingiber officinale TaxID=94328 RepID=UPI001C4BFB31|nr:uncharacterized protein LOC122045953 [Zingiber officinale]